MRLEQRTILMRQWTHTTKFRIPHSSATVVECGEDLGIAKLTWMELEKLAADLAQLVDAAVPSAEWGEVGTLRAVISRVEHTCCYPLERKDGSPEMNRRCSLAAENRALRTVSGLLAFLAWIGATDHNDNTNLVIEVLGEEECRARAIDFEQTLTWPDGVDHFSHFIGPPRLLDVVDPQHIEQQLLRIENLKDQDIQACCAASGVPEAVWRQIAEALIRRRGLLRRFLSDRGWLPKDTA
jgi:hypothetical protein